MVVHRATLIQDISTYSEIVKPYLLPIMFKYKQLNYFVVLEWIIREEVEEIYLLFDRNHIHGRHPYDSIKHELRKVLPFPLERLTSSYIKAPRLFESHQDIDLEIRHNRDLYIRYYSHKPKMYLL